MPPDREDVKVVPKRILIVSDSPLTLRAAAEAVQPLSAVVLGCAGGASLREIEEEAFDVALVDVGGQHGRASALAVRDEHSEATLVAFGVDLTTEAVAWPLASGIETLIPRTASA